MKTRVCLAAFIIACAVASEAKAQHFYDHDSHWKSGSMGDNGTVPDDYLVPMPVGEITRCSPTMGYRVSKAQLGQQASYFGGGTNYGAVGGLSEYSGGGGYYRPVKRAAKHTTGGAQHDDTNEWLNGLGGTGYGNLTVTNQQRRQFHQAQAEAKRQQQLQQQGNFTQPPAIDPGGLIRGSLGGTTFRMPGRGQF